MDQPWTRIKLCIVQMTEKLRAPLFLVLVDLKIQFDRLDRIERIGYCAARNGFVIYGVLEKYYTLMHSWTEIHLLIHRACLAVKSNTATNRRHATFSMSTIGICTLMGRR